MRELLKFAAVGGAATALHYLVFWIGLSVLEGSATLSTAVGYAAGSVLSYAANYSFTFRSTASHGRAFPSFYLMVALGWVLNTGLVYLGAAWLDLPPWPVQITATVIVFAFNFIVSRKWVFANER